MLSLNKIKFFIFFAFLFISIDNIECNCVLKVANQTNRPLLTQKFGSKVVILTNNTAKFELSKNESIEAYCGSGFAAFTTFDSSDGQKTFDIPCIQKIKFECYSDQIYIDQVNTHNRQPYLHKNPIISCRGVTYTMFESKDTLMNCKNAVSYLLGAKTNNPMILAGLCYDLNKLNLNYVNYIMHVPSTMLEKSTELYPIGINSESMLEPIKKIQNFFSFPSNDIVKEDLAKQSKTNFWLNVADYEKGNIIQSNTDYNDALNDNSNMLDIIWWRPLRVGNWNRFVKLLEERVKSVDYNIYSGTSGVVQLPGENECENETYLEINYSGGKKFVPEFIWTYLESALENVVVVAYNSPYFDHFPENATVICKDMCDEFEWIKPMKNSRYISTLGVFYCCQPDEVSAYLDGFPKLKNKTIADEQPATNLR